MSKINPIVIIDSDSDLASDISSRPLPASVTLLPSDSALVPVAPSAAASTLVLPSDSVVSRKKSSLPWKNLTRTLLASSSDSETETDSDFHTPPTKSVIKADWEDKKIGEDTSFKPKTPDFSPPYDPFGPTHNDENDENDEKKKQEEEDFQLAVYLDMDLNGRPAKHEANERMKRARDCHDASPEEQPRKKSKDRSLYWQQRYAMQKARRLSNVSLHFVQTYFCGIKNFNRTAKKGPQGALFKRAIIPGSNGTVQHDVIISSERVFFRIVDERPILLQPDENGKIEVRDNCVPDADLLFRATFPEPVFPFNV